MLFCMHRCDVSLLPAYFRFSTMRRKLCAHWHSDPGCTHLPLFSITLDHVVVDELHLLLRITDQLEKGLIMAAISNDEVKDSINI